MEKTIKLNETDYKLKSSLFTIISYRSTFGSELFSDIKKIEKIGKTDTDDLTAIIDTIFRLTYILHKPFTNKSYDEFLNDFDFSIISDIKALEELAKVIAELIGTVNKDKAPQLK